MTVLDITSAEKASAAISVIDQAIDAVAENALTKLS